MARLRVRGGSLSGSGSRANIAVWDQCGLFVMSFAKYVRISMMTHHSAGLDDLLNVRRK